MQPAYFLHSRPYRETSLLVELLTPEQGRISAVWRGGRRSKGGAAQLFQPLLADSVGKGDLKTLRQVEAAGPVWNLSGPALFSGFYLNEILVRLLPRDEAQTVLFAHYADALSALANAAPPAALLRRFECLLLETLGYGIDFGHDSDSGEPVSAAFAYDFHPERGFTRAPAAHALVNGAALLQLQAGDFESAPAASAAKRINRMALARLLGQRPLKSRELFLAARA